MRHYTATVMRSAAAASSSQLSLRETATAAMKCLILIFLIFMPQCTRGSSSKSFKYSMERLNSPIYKLPGVSVVGLNHRRALRIDVALNDYDDAGANTKHEPRKGKPGSGVNKNT